MQRKAPDPHDSRHSVATRNRQKTADGFDEDSVYQNNASMRDNNTDSLMSFNENPIRPSKEWHDEGEKNLMFNVEGAGRGNPPDYYAPSEPFPGAPVSSPMIEMTDADPVRSKPYRGTSILNKRGLGAARVDKLTRTDTFVHKTKYSRVCYAISLLAIVLFWPFWLKLITLKYETKDKPYSIYNESIGLRLTVPALLKGASPDDCAIAQSGDCSDTDVTYGAYVNITNFHHPAKVSSVSYVQLLASFTPEDKPNDFFVVSETSVLDGGLIGGDQFLRVCRGPDFRNKENTNQEVNTTTTRRGARALLQNVPVPAPTRESEKVGDCCMGGPGGVYLVACIVQALPKKNLYDKVSFDSKKGLNEYCVEVDGVCGSSCGFATAAPKYCQYLESSERVDDVDDDDYTVANGRWPDEPGRGYIPKDLLMNLDNEFKDDDAGSPFTSEKGNGLLNTFFHVFFIVFMTISALSMWISFLPGIGRDSDEPPPSLHNVERHMNSKGRGKETDAMVCVAFSISASEPRMMILRNMVGKLMAWCHEHKLFLKERPWDKNKEENEGSQSDSSDSSRKVSWDDSASSNGSSNLSPLDKVSFIDLFQDEGNRVGCYALWDAFSDLVDGADLKFIESLADEMKNMKASDAVVKSNRMPHDKYVLSWDVDKTKEYVKSKIGIPELKTRAMGALDDIQLDGKAIMNDDAKSLEAVLKEAGIEKKVHMVRLLAIIEEIREDIKNYNADAQEMKRADELLSPELESLALKCGCRKMNIDMFKLAWSAYDLLNSLGDPAFWTLDKDNEQGTPNFRQVVMETHKNQTAKQQDLQKKWQTGNFKYLESDAYIIKLEEELQLLKSQYSEVESPNVRTLQKKQDEITGAKARRALAQQLEIALEASTRGGTDSAVHFQEASELKKRLQEAREKAIEQLPAAPLSQPPPPPTSFESVPEDSELRASEVSQQQKKSNSQLKKPSVQLTTKDLVKWGTVLKREKKDPFSYEVLRKAFGEKIDHPALKDWWAIYRNYGAKKAAKNFDFTRNKQISFRFYATHAATEDDDKLSMRLQSVSRSSSLSSLSQEDMQTNRPQTISRAKVNENSGTDELQRLTMFYCSRAKPKEYVSMASQTIVPGCIVRMKHQFEVTSESDSFTLNCTNRRDGKTPRAYARLCYGRVKRVRWRGLNVGRFMHELFGIGTSVELMDCSSYFMMEMQSKENRGETGVVWTDENGNDLRESAWSGDKTKRQRTESMAERKFAARLEKKQLLRGGKDYEFRVPINKVTPLVPCRGKAGGMNYAMDILDEYLVKNNEYLRSGSGSSGRGTMLFAVFDCRHMGQQGFWDAVVPHFFKYKATENIFEDELVINHKNSFVQMPQTFAELPLQEDFFDMRNEYGFRMANTIRSGVSSVTSCGTNACWNIKLEDKELLYGDFVEIQPNVGFSLFNKTSPGGDRPVSLNRLDTISGPMGEKEMESHMKDTKDINRSVLDYRFNTQTMIEDTASSHEAILKGTKGIYHFERLVLGARKGAADYMAALFRWSQGGVQLMCNAYLQLPHFKCLCRGDGKPKWMSIATPEDPSGKQKNHFLGCFGAAFCEHVWTPIIDALWPWIFLAIYVVPVVSITLYLQLLNIDHDPIRDMYGEKFCNGFFGKKEGCNREDFVILSLVYNKYYFMYIIWMVGVANLVYLNRQVATYVIMLENTTYFFNSSSAFFWALFPIYMSFTGTVPLNYDAAMLTLGGLWLEVFSGRLTEIIKTWAPLDKGKPPPETALLRAQQMYFLAAPLHMYALLEGSKSGCGVRCLRRDKSFWSSFQNSTSLVVAKVWAILLSFTLALAILFAIINFFIMGFRIELFIGLIMSMVILGLIYEPVLAMFFHAEMTSYKKRNHNKGLYVRISRAVCGEHVLITPKHIYTVLWSCLLLLAITSPSARDGVFFKRWLPKGAFFGH